MTSLNKSKKALVPALIPLAGLGVFVTAGVFVGAQIMAEKYIRPDIFLATGERVDSLAQFFWGTWDQILAYVIVPLLLFAIIALFIALNVQVIKIHSKIFGAIRKDLKPIMKTMMNMESRFLDMIDLQPEKALKARKKGRKTRLSKG